MKNQQDNDTLAKRFIASASSDTECQASALKDLIWQVVLQRPDIPEVAAIVARHQTELVGSLQLEDRASNLEVHKVILEEAFLPFATNAEAKKLRFALESLDWPTSKEAWFTSVAALWQLASSVNEKAGSLTIDIEVPEGLPAKKINVGTNTSISFRRTLRVPEDGREYPLPADLGTLPIYRIEEYADKVPPHWLDEGGFFIPLYQREALFIQFGGVPWRPNIAKVAVGRINAITGKPYDENIRRHEQDYVVMPDQKWLDGINTGKDTVSQFVAMPLGHGYTIEEQMTDEDKYGGFQLVVIDPKEGRFPLEDPVLSTRKLRQSKLRRVHQLISELEMPYQSIGLDFLEPDHQRLQMMKRALSEVAAKHLLREVRESVRLRFPEIEELGWTDIKIEDYAKAFRQKTSEESTAIESGQMLHSRAMRGHPLGARQMRDEPWSKSSDELGIARGGTIKQQILRDHYGSDSWDAQSCKRLVIRIVNSTIFQRITGKAPPESPITMEQYIKSGIPWFDSFEESAESVGTGKLFSFIKGIASIAKLRGSPINSEEVPTEVRAHQIRRIRTPSRSEQIDNFTVRAEVSLEAGRIAQAHREATLALGLIGFRENGYREEWLRSLHVRSMCNNHLSRFQEAEADATDLISFSSSRADRFAIRAFSYMRLGDYSLAISDAMEACLIDAKCIQALEVAAETYLLSGENDEAEECASQALRLKPDSVAALRVSAEYWLQAGYPEEAIKYLSQALQVDARDAQIYAARADAFIKAGLVHEAISDLEAALKIDPRNERALHLNLGIYK
jgi:tetratricopeptide (TPR) repeat protein